MGSDASAPFQARDVLSRAELMPLHERSDLRGALALATEVGLIGLALWLVHLHFAWWTVVAAIVFVGLRQAALGELMHEAAHGALFVSPGVNHWVGTWLLAAPRLEDLDEYWARHLRHHKLYLTDGDPDLVGFAWLPTTRGKVARQAFRAVIGVTGVFWLLELALVAAGLVHFSASGQAQLRDQRGRTVRHAVAGLARRFGRPLLANLVLAGLFVALRAPALYVLWWAALLTVKQLMGMIRDVLEHGGCVSTDPRRASRTLETSAVGRFLYAPHGSAFHTEHHLLMRVPFFRLPRLHRMLKEQGALVDAQIDPGLLAVLTYVSDAARCPARPPAAAEQTDRTGDAPVEEGLVQAAVVMPWVGEHLGRALRRFYGT